MFGVLPDEPLPFENIYGALYDRKPPPPNQSTQLQPLTSNNFVHELDKCTQVSDKITYIKQDYSC